MNMPKNAMLIDHSMERLDFSEQRPYEAIEAAIHLNRYLMAKGLCAGRRVLDIACGQGYGAYLMAERWGAESVTAVDISSEALAVAARDFASPRIQHRELDAQSLVAAFPAKQFDLVVSLETFEHLQNPQAFLAGVAHVLAPGGAAIITCPNDHWYYRSPEEQNPFHVRKYTFNEFKELTEKTLGAGTFLLGSPLSGFMSFDPQQLAGIQGPPRLMLSGSDLDAAVALPTEEAITPQNCRYFVGIWGQSAKKPLTAALYPASMDSSSDAHRALQVEHLREEVISLRTAGYEAEKLRTRIAELESARTVLKDSLAEVRDVASGQTQQFRNRIAELESARSALSDSLAEARDTATTQAQQFRTRIAELESARTSLIESLAEVREASAGQAQQFRTRITELESALAELESALAKTREASGVEAQKLRSRVAELEAKETAHRHDGLRIAALRAEAEYLREEFGATRWALEQELQAARNALSVQKNLKIRIRRLGGRVLRRLGLRK